MSENPVLVGKGSEIQISVEGFQCKALLDTGSQITTISEDFYSTYLKHLPLHPVTSRLDIFGSTGHRLRYQGFIDVKLTCPSINGVIEIDNVLALVVPSTTYSLNVPVLIGTNVLNPVVCNSLGDGRVVRTTRPEVIPPNSSVVVKGITRPWPVGHGGLVFAEAVCESALARLPGGVRVIPSLLEMSNMEHHSTAKVSVHLQNFNSKSVTIPSNSVMCALNQVELSTSDDLVQQFVEEKHKSDIFDLLNLSDCNGCPDQIQKFKEFLTQWDCIFSHGDFDIGHTNAVKHQIKLLDDTPIKIPYRRIPPSMVDETKTHLKKMLNSGVIRPSMSPYSAPMVLVRKKDGSLRMCVDYRALNQVTKKDAYSLPRIEETLDTLHGACIFSSLDLKSGYWQIEVEEKDKEKTAFTAGPLGFFEFNFLPFGLCGSPATFQRLMNLCMRDVEHCLIYLDDIIIFSSSFEEHLKKLEEVFGRLKQYGLKLNPHKCQFLRSKLKYLGHIVSADGVEVDPDKVSALKSMSPPKNVEELQRFLGFVGYQRRFIKDLSKVAKPLTDLLKGQNCTRKRVGRRSRLNIPFEWGEKQQESFESLIHLCTSTPVLGYADFSLPFELHVDASLDGLGAVLYQMQENQRRVIAYASRGLTAAESKYPIHKLEFLALKWAVTDKFYDYLYGHKFQVWTDNNPLTYVLTSAKLDATGHRWLAALSSFDFSLCYKPGKCNLDADMLSRIPRNVDSEEVVRAVLQLKDQDAFVHSLCFKQTVVNHLEELPSVDPLDVAQLQRDDPVLRYVIELFEAKKDKPSNVAIKELDKDVVLLLRHWDKLNLRDRILFRNVLIDGQEVSQQVVPQNYRPLVLKSLHDDMGHVGRDRTTELLRKRFYWPGMFTETEKYIKDCTRCICRKTPGDKAPLVPMSSSYPMEIVCIDFLTVEPSKGYENILVLTDHFTKFSQAYATKNQSAKTTARVLFENYVVHYGIPSRIHSDQGRNFESKVIRELCELMGMAKSRTTPYHAMGNGIVERFNRTLLQMLGTLEADKKAKWKDYLSSVVHAYNCTKHQSTGFTPYKLMFGRDPKLPVDLQFGLNQENGDDCDYSKYVQDLNKELNYAWDLVSKNQACSSVKQKEQYDIKQRGATLQVGDRVFIRNVGLKGRNKLADKWLSDMYVVRCQPNPDIPVFKVSPEGGGKVKILHRNLLLPITGGCEISSHSGKKQKLAKSPVSLKDGSDVQDILLESESSDSGELLFVKIDRNDSQNNESLSDGVSEDQNESSMVVSGDHDPDLSGDVSVESVESETLVESDVQVDTGFNELPVPAPRRSLRKRNQPAWFRSGDFVTNQLVASVKSENPDWMNRANFLLKIVSDYSHLPESVLLKIIEVVKNL